MGLFFIFFCLLFVRVVLQGPLAEGLLDLSVGGIIGDTQDLVRIVAFVHGTRSCLFVDFKDNEIKESVVVACCKIRETGNLLIVLFARK
jgi:hypothetical protein